MAQSWRDLLFAHWPIPLQTVRALVPPQLELDTFDGTAWVGIVPFRMSDVRPRWIPSMPWLSAFPELNVRTYVRAKNPAAPNPGVYFFSLDAANPVAVVLARRFFKLPYFNAQMGLSEQHQYQAGTTSAAATIHYTSHRTHKGAAGATFDGTYAPVGNEYLAQPGTLEHWLTERYCFYTVDERQRVYRCDIHHTPWPLQSATADITVNTLVTPVGMTLPDTPPLLHFARRLDVVAWPLKRIA